MGFKKVFTATASAQPGSATSGAAPAIPKGIMGKLIKALQESGALQSVISGREAPSQPKGLRGIMKNIKDSKREGTKKNVAESTVDSATAMKKGGPVNKMGRAVKRKTADVKGRAMRGK